MLHSTPLSPIDTNKSLFESTSRDCKGQQKVLERSHSNPSLSYNVKPSRKEKQLLEFQAMRNRIEDLEVNPLPPPPCHRPLLTYATGGNRSINIKATAFAKKTKP